MRPSTRRQLAFAAALLAGLFLLGAGVLYLLYLRVPFVRREVTRLFPQHRGELVATIGIPLAEMHARSSLPISAGFTYGGTTSGVFEPFFDWQVAGTSLRFRGCRYGMYNADKAGLIDSLQVSVSPRRLRWSEMVEELRATGDQLKMAGFVPTTKGFTVPADVRLAEWLAREEPSVDWPSTHAFIWRKGDLELEFHAEQQNAGEWVQRVSLTPAIDHPDPSTVFFPAPEPSRR